MGRFVYDANLGLMVPATPKSEHLKGRLLSGAPFQALIMQGASFSGGTLFYCGTGASMAVSNNGRTGTAGASASWTSGAFRKGTTIPLAGTVCYMEWKSTSAVTSSLFGLIARSNWTGSNYLNNPNGSGAVWGVQPNISFQGPQRWDGNGAGTNAAFAFTQNDVIGMMFTASTKVLTMFKNNTLFYTSAALANLDFDPFTTSNTSSQGSVSISFTTNLIPSQWVYPQSGAVPFPQTLA